MPALVAAHPALGPVKPRQLGYSEVAVAVLLGHYVKAEVAPSLLHRERAFGVNRYPDFRAGEDMLGRVPHDCPIRHLIADAHVGQRTLLALDQEPRSHENLALHVSQELPVRPNVEFP